MSTTTVSAKLAAIHVPDNVRELDPDHVDALASSIQLQGILVPLVVQAAVSGDNGHTYDLVAGFHRYAAATTLGLEEVPIVIRGENENPGIGVDADRATENILRKQLNAYEEAIAVKAMLDRGLTDDGAAQALGWSKQRVAARMKLLELPERAQKMIGEGILSLAAIEPLLTIGAVSKRHQEMVVAYLDHQDTSWEAERFAGEPGWVLGQAINSVGGKDHWAAYMNSITYRDLTSLKLGKKVDAQMAEAEKIHKEIDRYAYGPPTVSFAESDVDQARAAGVLIEFDKGARGGSSPIIVDRPLYRELVKGAIARTLEELKVKAANKGKRKPAAKKDADPLADAKSEHRAAMREITNQAHGVNLELGASLINGLSVVKADDMDVAKFFVYGLLGHMGAQTYFNDDTRVTRLAAAGIRLVIEEFRKDVTKTKKNGERGALKMDYGDRVLSSDPKAARAWIVKFLDGAKTAGDLYGRALVVIAAQRHAMQIVVNRSQRRTPIIWSSHKDIAEKALTKLVGPHLPASLTALEKAIAKADKALRTAELGTRNTGVATPAPDDDGEDFGDEDFDDVE